MAFPKEVTRITKGGTTPTHKPKHQLYQPGFNEGNGCWLPGSWITIPEQYFAVRKVEHEAMYGKVRAAKQHYRDPAGLPENMTQAQRQAWEHFSGQGTAYCRGEGGGVGPVYIELAAGNIRKDSVEWLKKTGRKVLQVVKMPDGTLSNQQEAFGIPDDVVEACLTPHEPPDPWKSIIEQNRAREDEMLDAFIGEPPADVGTSAGVFGTVGDFMATMAFQSLISLEEGIIRAEWDEQRGMPDKYTDVAKERARYVEARKKLREKFGEHFDAHHEARRASHNECARANLGEHGAMYCFVLPVFYDDGTHEPVGPRDVPWGVEKEASP